MYWPEDNRRKKRNVPGRGLALLLTLAVSVFMAGELNGWWSLFSPAGNQKSEAVAPATIETPGSDVVSATDTPSVPTLTSLPAVEGVKEAPHFTLPDLYDETIRHSLSDYAGRPVILNFWASWCVPCREEMPALQRAHEQYRDHGLVLLGINQTYIDDLEAARAFMGELNLTFASARDDNGRVSEGDYRVVALPTTVFVTAAGEVAHVQIGQLTNEQIETYSQRLVAGAEIVP